MLEVSLIDMMLGFVALIALRTSDLQTVFSEEVEQERCRKM